MQLGGDGPVSAGWAGAPNAMSDLPMHHGLLVYDNDDDFVDRSGSYLGAGTEGGEVGLAVLSQGKWALLREALGDAAVRIRFIDRDSLYSRPLDALASYSSALRRATAEGAPAVRLLGEIPVPGSQHKEAWTQDQLDAWTLYEAVINRAFADQPISILCGYDVREQPAAAVDGAFRTHPRVLVDGWENNPRYEDPAELVGALTRTPEALSDLREMPLDDDANDFSVRLRNELASLQAPEPQAEKLVLAAREIFENAVAYGQGAQSQRLGRVGTFIVWELSDRGRGFDDPLAGYLPPRQEEADGSGLWLARQLTHDVEFFTSQRGFTARLWI